MSDQVNPYNTPLHGGQSSGFSTPLATSPDLIRRHGNRLLVWDGAVLPPRCIRTNAPIGQNDRTITKRMAYTPGWVWIFILAGLLIALLLAVILQKRFTIAYCLSEAEAIRRRNRLIVGWLLLPSSLVMAVLGGIASGEGSTWGSAGLVAGILLLLTSMVLLVSANPLTVVGHKNGWFILKGCSREFLDSIGPA